MAMSSASSLLQKMRAFGIAGGAGDGAPAQRAVDVDRAAGDDFRAGGDRAQDGDVAFRKDHRLAGAHRPVVHHRGRPRGAGSALPPRQRPSPPARRLRRRSSRGDDRREIGEILHARRAAAGDERRHAEAEQRGLRALHAHDADVALGEIGDELGQPLLVERQRRHVEDDRPADEIARRLLRPSVELGEPVLQRRLRREKQRHEGTATEAERFAWLDGDVRVHGQPQPR